MTTHTDLHSLNNIYELKKSIKAPFKMITYIKNFNTAKILMLFFVVLGITNSAFSQSNIERPNIIWLVTEDNSKEYLKLYDKDGAPMPNIEKLAEKGIIFNNAFSNAAVCSVARSTIISGSYAPRVGAQYHRRMEQVPMPDSLKMFPEYLREVGYYTTNRAKEDYNFIGSDKTWDESSGKATYKNRKPGQPFFHVQNYAGTHEASLHYSEEKMQNTKTQTSLSTVPVAPYHPDTEIFRYANAYYRDLHIKIDTQMGTLIAELEAEGLMENTIIFYYGDHGGILPRSKGYIYESGLEVPMVIYVPEKWQHLVSFKVGSRTDAFVEFIDFGPTVLNLAGVKTPKQMDGKPFLGKNVTSADLEKRNTTFSYADRFDEKYDLVRSLRKDNYKYMRNYQSFNIDGLFNFYRYRMLAYQEWKKLFEEGKLNAIQQQFFLPRQPESLYDLNKDPHEVNNLANDPAYQTVLKELRSDLQQIVKSMPDLGFYPESYFLEKGLANPVKFGQAHKKDIQQFIDIADLSLFTFAKAKDGIRLALNSDNPWNRYWALNTCSTFGDEASYFYTKAEDIVKNDPENLVRMRAVEFLKLNDKPVSTDLILEILKNANSEPEATLLLNTVALLKTVKDDFQIVLSPDLFDPSWLDKKGALVNERIKFINDDK